MHAPQRLLHHAGGGGQVEALKAGALGAKGVALHHESVATHQLNRNATQTLADLADELGDLLLQVLFHARIAAEAGTFDIDDVAATLVAKLQRRHPHVFGDVEVADAHEVVTNWQAIKASERAEAGEEPHPDGELAAALERIPRGLPAMERATKTVNRVRKAGLDPAALAAGLEGEAAPSSPAGQLGAAVLAALDAGLDPESELRRWTLALRGAALREAAISPGE